MAQSPENATADTRMDPANLYREDIFTDRKVGTIRRLTPVKTDGSPDAARKAIFVGDAQVLTTVGPMPLSFEIPAQSLEEAVAKYGDAAKLAFERAVQELQEMRRQAASSIVIPERGGGLGPGGLPGGGKIKLP
jgi:hypothetical protein